MAKVVLETFIVKSNQFVFSSDEDILPEPLSGGRINVATI